MNRFYALAVQVTAMRIIFFVVAVMLMVSPAQPDNLSTDLPDDLRAIANDTLTDSRMTRLAGTCPDQLWESRSLLNIYFLPDCETADGCRRQCGLGDGGACWDLARMFQDHEPDVAPAVSGSWFARACANNYASGCTNRGAGILFAEGDDPFASKSEQTRRQCAARSFVLSCQAEDAWGCAMHAADQVEGVLGPSDRSAAKQAAEKACALDPADSVGACSFARSWMGE